MSYQTEADRYYKEAKEHIKSATSCLAKLVIDRVDDWSDYSTESKRKVMDTFLALFKLCESLEQ